MRVGITIAIFLLLLPLQRAWGQATSTPNGCGSGWSRYIVPNSVPLLACKFKSACDAHDICYGACENKIDGDCEYQRCRRGGDLFGKSICLEDEKLLVLMAKASARRAKCDQALYKDIYEQNDKRMACRAFAVIYRYAVKTWGDDKFLGADAGAVITQSREEYEKAIRDFFENGTEEQFKRIVEEDAANRQVVNMKRNIGFSKEKGLVNVK